MKTYISMMPWFLMISNSTKNSCQKWQKRMSISQTMFMKARRQSLMKRKKSRPAVPCPNAIENFRKILKSQKGKEHPKLIFEHSERGTNRLELLIVRHQQVTRWKKKTFLQESLLKAVSARPPFLVHLHKRRNNLPTRIKLRIWLIFYGKIMSVSDCQKARTAPQLGPVISRGRRIRTHQC